MNNGICKHFGCCPFIDCGLSVVNCLYMCGGCVWSCVWGGGCYTLIVYLVSCGFKRSVSLPHGAVG